MQPAVTVPVSSPAVFYVPANAITTSKYDRYPQKASTIIGVLQIIFGVICLILNSFSISKIIAFGVIGHGIWGGIMFIVTGAIGCSAGKKKSKCQVIGYMVLCIIAACCAGVLLALGISGSVYASVPFRCYHGRFGPFDEYVEDHDCLRRHRQETAFQACLAIAGLIEGLLGIFGAVICCKAGVCCCTTPQTGFVLASYSSNSGVLLQQPGVQGLQVPHQGTTAAFNSQQVPMVSVHSAYPTSFDQYGMAQAGATAPYAYDSTEDDVKHPIDPPPYSR